MTTMANLAATGAASNLGFIAETVFGTTPATPSLAALRCRPPSFNPEAEDFINMEIGNGRMAKGVQRTFEHGTVSIPTDLIYGNADSIIEAILQGSWNTNALAMGAENRSFSCELDRSDASTPYFVLARGVLFNSFELNVSAEGTDPVLLALNGMAAEISPAASTADAGGGYTAAVTNTPLLSKQAAFQLDSTGVSVLSMNATFTDARDVGRELGAGNPTSFQRGQAGRSLEVRLSGYAANKDHLDRFKNQAAHELDVTFTDAEGNSLLFNVPTMKATGATTESGDGGAIRWEQSFTAYDAAGSTLLNLTRTPV